MKHVKKIRKKLYELKNLEGIEFVHGCDKRKTTLQKSIEKLEEYLLKFKEYNKKVYTCGNRNSYSKTDIYATFMRMKENAMKMDNLNQLIMCSMGWMLNILRGLLLGLSQQTQLH